MLDGVALLFVEREGVTSVLELRVELLLELGRVCCCGFCWPLLRTSLLCSTSRTDGFWIGEAGLDGWWEGGVV